MLKRYLTTLGQKRLTLFLHVAVVVIAVQLVMYDTLFPSTADQVSSQVEYLFSLGAGKHGWSLQAPEKQFYEARDFEVVWFEGEGLSLNALNMYHLLETVDKDGLRRTDYVVADLDTLYAKKKKTILDYARFDILLTHAALIYIDHLANGRLSEEQLSKFWLRHPKRIVPATILEESLRNDDLVARIHDLSPPHQQYRLLKETLAKLRVQQSRGGWPLLPNKYLIKPGDFDSRVQVLRQRLKQTGDLDQSAPDSKRFDQQLTNAVMNYQRRHGILVDGTVGAETIETLNVPIQRRIDQVLLNMERWRYVPRDLGEPHILVNASGFELVGSHNNEDSLYMRVIVGDPEFETPMFSTVLSQIVLNPTWHVPRSIAVNELLPKLRKNNRYLGENHFYVSRVNGEQISEEELEATDWTSMDENNFPMDVHQSAGPDNPLGHYKFVIPNSESIFLHDTNNRMLFDNIKRDLSHGCIRVENPLRLASFLLSADSTWTLDAIQDFVKSNETHLIDLRRPVATHIVNFTAWVNDSGLVSFYHDIYNLDQRIREHVAL